MSTPTGRARELGANLRFFRERSEWSEKKAAEFLEISQGQLCRIELGTRGISETNVARALTLYGVRGMELSETLALARELNDNYRVKPHYDKLPDELRTLIHLESTASHIDWYEPVWLPGQLQTEDYARALIQWGGLHEEEGIELRVQARMDRQKLLHHKQRPGFNFFIHENALAPVVISPEIMSEQAMALLLACNLPDCQLRIVPSDAVPGGAFGSPFLLMRYRDYHPIACVENFLTSEFLEDEAITDHYRTIVRRLDGLALSAEQSQRRLASLAP